MQCLDHDRVVLDPMPVAVHDGMPEGGADVLALMSASRLLRRGWMFEAGEHTCTPSSRGFGVHCSGVDLTALAGRERLWSVLVLQNELTLEDEHPCRKLVTVEVTTVHSRLVLGDADFVIEAIVANASAEVLLAHRGRTCAAVQSGDDVVES